VGMVDELKIKVLIKFVEFGAADRNLRKYLIVTDLCCSIFVLIFLE